MKFKKDLNYNIYKGDTLKVLDKLERTGEIKKGQFDLIITSPPYNLGKEYETKTSIKDYLLQQESVIEKLINLTSEKGSICWQVGNFVQNGEIFPLDIYYYEIFKKFDMKLRNRIIWHFRHGLHASKRFSGRYETILWFTKSDNYIFNLDKVRIDSLYPGKRYYKGEKKGQLSGNPKGKNPSDLWEIVLEDWEKEIWDIPNVKSNHPEKTEHPCQYPIELVERCILALTKEESWILDPYAGVGSTLVAALRRNRNVIGIEKEEKYIEKSKDRLEMLKNGTIRVRPLGKKVHRPKPTDKIAQYPLEWIEQKEN